MEGDHNESLSMRFSGTENDLNHILWIFEDSEDEIENFSISNYVAMTDIQSIFPNGQSDFVIATLNIQSINAKFDNLYAIVNTLSASGQYFGAICLQETWLTSDADVTLFEILGYKLIHQGSRCIVSRGKTEHGGKMEHRVFGKKHARRGPIFKSTWFLSSASSAAWMKMKLAIDHVFSISQKRNFTLLIYEFTRVLTSSALTHLVVEPLHVVKYDYVPVVHIFASFDWATGDIIVDIMAFLQT